MMHELYSVVEYAVVSILAVPASLACLYLLVLTCLSVRNTEPPSSSRRLTFDVIVPAHDEAAGIAGTVSNLQQLDWPTERFRVVVVADNCTDTTAEIARASGATVITRRDATRRGKGYALAHAFDWSRADGRSEAVVVVDADSHASANLLESFAARIERGACALQAHYGVLNAADSWRTRLMAIALGAIHKLRSRAREHLGLSCGIRGNGWCVTHALLRRLPYQAYSLTEDVEFGIDIGLAGERVGYCDESFVNGEMVSGADAARSQRQRWEGGRFKLIKSSLPKLLIASLKLRSAVCLDLALDLLVLPLSYIVLNVAALIVISVMFSFVAGSWLRWLAVADLVALMSYVGRGWMLSGVGMRGLLDLLRVPSFLVWKLLLLFSPRKPTEWIRTRREKS